VSFPVEQTCPTSMTGKQARKTGHCTEWLNNQFDRKFGHKKNQMREHLAPVSPMVNTPSGLPLLRSEFIMKYSSYFVKKKYYFMFMYFSIGKYGLYFTCIN
jgi:hypothetical protein